MTSAGAAKIVVKFRDTLPTACRSGVVANGPDLLEAVMITDCGLVRDKLRYGSCVEDLQGFGRASKMRAVDEVQCK